MTPSGHVITSTITTHDSGGAKPHNQLSQGTRRSSRQKNPAMTCMAKPDTFSNRATAAEAHDDIPRSPASGETIGDIIFAIAAVRSCAARSALPPR
jgi:hypothetical protein